MSSDEPPVILLRWCKDRCGIRLKKEYLRTWKAARRETITNYEAAYTDIVADFLKTDISITSEPIIQDDYNRNPIDTFPVGHLREGCGVILQIQDTLDIRHSTFSLLNSLNNATPVRQTYIERTEGDEVNLSRGMLLWVLTDGAKQVYAMELETIPDLDLKTPFGCKLLIKGCRVRRGMLLLTKDNVKVLGGEVPDLYGGDMIAELEDRCKRKLGIIHEPVTPLPTENGNNNSSGTTAASQMSTENNNRTRMAAHNSIPTENNNNNTNRSGMPAHSSMPIEEVDYFDDDMEYDDLVLDSIEKNMANSDMMDSVSRDTNITPLNMSNEGFSDDDFMEPLQISPSHRTTTLTKRTKTAEQTPIVNKKSRVELDPPLTSTSTARELTQTAEVVPAPMDTDHDDDDENEYLSFVDPTLWENFEAAAKNDMIEVDDRGRANCTFDTLKNTLNAMKDQTGGDIPDTFRVKLQCIKMARLRMDKTQHFYLELELGDPVVKYEKNVKHEGVIRAVVHSELMYRLIGKDKQSVKDIFVQGGQAAVAKHVLKPFHKKVTQVVAYLTLDMTVLEEDSSDPNHSLMPLVIDYEQVSD